MGDDNDEGVLPIEMGLLLVPVGVLLIFVGVCDIFLLRIEGFFVFLLKRGEEEDPWCCVIC